MNIARYIGNMRTFLRNLRHMFRHNLQRDHFLDEHCIFPLLQYTDYRYRSEPAGVVGKPHILGVLETLNLLNNSNKSLVRYGDGEFFIIKGTGVPFQDATPTLSKRLAEILSSNDEDIIICLPAWIWYQANEHFKENISSDFSFTESPWLRLIAEPHLCPGKTYGNANCTYVVMYPELCEPWRSIWQDKDIALICGDRVFNKLKNNVFDNASSIEHLHIPSCGAFSHYDDILQKASKIEKHKLICIIAGPTATVLAYDLAKLGYRALDVGHLAKAYDIVSRNLPPGHELRTSFFHPD